MLAFTTKIDLKKSEIVTTCTFNQEQRTFGFNGDTFPLLDAMKTAAEDMHNQLLDFLAKLVDSVENGPLTQEFNDSKT